MTTKVKGNANPQSIVVDGVTYVTRQAIKLRYGIGQSTFTMKSKTAGINGHKIPPYRCRFFTIEEAEQIFRQLGYDSRPRTTIADHMETCIRQMDGISERLKDKAFPKVERTDLALQNVIRRALAELDKTKTIIVNGRPFWEEK